MPKTLTIADLTERLGLPADQQNAVAAWTGEEGTFGVTEKDHYTIGAFQWLPIFDEADIDRLAAAWRADRSGQDA